jgi:IS30 family transposase
VRFCYRMVPEVYQVFWAGMAAGEFINDAAIAAGSYRKQGARWLAAAGGVRPRRGRGLKGRCLTLAQREEIALGRARGESIRAIAALLGRSPSTVSRELRRNVDGRGRYRATAAHALAYHRASRPKPGKLVQNLELRGKVEADLAKKYSPEQIAGRLKVEFPDQPEMQVSTETIYQSPVCAVSRRPETGSDQVFENRPGSTQALPQTRATQESDPEYDQHRRATGRGRGSSRARPLGG